MAPQLFFSFILIHYTHMQLSSWNGVINQTLKSTATTEEWHYQKPTITINFGDSMVDSLTPGALLVCWQGVAGLFPCGEGAGKP